MGCPVSESCLLAQLTFFPGRRRKRGIRFGEKEEEEREKGKGREENLSCKHQEKERGEKGEIADKGNN